MEKELLKIKNLKVHFFLDEGEVPAVDGLNLTLHENETLAIVGESGCGKSVTSLSVLRIVPSPPGKVLDGEIIYKGRDLLKLSEREMQSIRGNEISMIFQEPLTSLNPVFSIGHQIMESLCRHQGMSKEQAEAKTIEMLGLVGLEAIDHSDDPAIFSHSSTKALCHHRRNASDEQIKRCSAKGGVICVCPHSIMCDDDNSKWPTVDRFIDHILHIAEIASIDNVGVGTDRWKRSTLFAKMKRISFGRTLPGWYGGFDDFHKQVEGFNYFDKWENFVDRMLARGLSGQEASKVLGGNLMRVFHQVMDKNIAK